MERVFDRNHVTNRANAPLNAPSIVAHDHGKGDSRLHGWNSAYSTMGLNPAAVTPELCNTLKRAGFKSVMCTPESASETTLKTLHKGFQKHAVVRAAKA